MAGPRCKTTRDTLGLVGLKIDVLETALERAVLFGDDQDHSDLLERPFDWFMNEGDARTRHIHRLLLEEVVIVMSESGLLEKCTRGESEDVMLSQARQKPTDCTTIQFDWQHVALSQQG
jgi:hypothetical protein